MSLNPNVKVWKNADFVTFCQSTPKYSELTEFIKANSIDGAFFFTLVPGDFVNIPENEISKEGVTLFFEMQTELSHFVGSAEQEQEQEHPNSASIILIDQKNKLFEFNQPEIKLGRDNQCHIFYEDKSISRNHASIIKVAHSYFIRDESSSNGTFMKLLPRKEYQLIQGMILDIPKIAEVFIVNLGLLQVKIKYNLENSEDGKEFTLNLWGQQAWVVGSVQKELVCESAENANLLEVQYFEIRNNNNRNIIKILHEEGIWNKIGSKDLKDIFKYYPLKKGDSIRIGDDIELKIPAECVFEDFSPETCLCCKITYPDSVEFINLDCKHAVYCKVCKNTELLCPVCNEPIKSFETISNVCLIFNEEII